MSLLGIGFDLMALVSFSLSSEVICPAKRTIGLMEQFAEETSRERESKAMIREKMSGEIRKFRFCNYIGVLGILCV